jgi:hypothetical protein
MRRLFIATVIAYSIALAGLGGALATAGPNSPGQPNVSCANYSSSPTGFSTSGFATAGANYAGSDGTHSKLNAQSTAAVSQYDVACLQVSQP